MRIDYPDLEILHARARRERAEGMYRLISDLGKWIFRHASRAHLAHQRKAPAEKVIA